jgi:hypothetical protein
MFCTNCGEETDLKLRHCQHCQFDLIHVQSLLDEDDLDDDLEDEFRDASECAKRCIVLYALKSVALGAETKSVVAWLQYEDLWPAVSNDEKSFFLSANPTETQVINASWRVEALSLLLWALGKNVDISDLSTMCDTDKVDTVCNFYLRSTLSFIESSKLVSESEIYDINEQIYDAHWKVRDAQINNKPVDKNYDSGVIMERHHAINWLMGYCGQDWDDVTTDT